MKINDQTYLTSVVATIVVYLGQQDSNSRSSAGGKTQKLLDLIINDELRGDDESNVDKTGVDTSEIRLDPAIVVNIGNRLQKGACAVLFALVCGSQQYISGMRCYAGDD